MSAALVARLDLALQWSVRLVWMNVCWLGLTAMGGILLGVGPASLAALSVGRRWARGETDVEVGTCMWRLWRRHWVLANAVTVLATALLGALMASWWLSRALTPVPAAVTQGLVLLALLLMAALTPHLLWIVGSEDPARRRRVPLVFTAALAVGIGRPFLTLALLALAIGWPALLIASGWPGLLPVCGASVPLTLAAWCIHRTFPPPARPTDQT